jgi:hypothetical protein
MPELCVGGEGCGTADFGRQMMARCNAELCPSWTGDGCICDVIGERPDPVGSGEIPAEIYEQLSVTYADEGCRIWWESRNSWLAGQSPKLRWEAGYRTWVLEAVERLEGGSSG